MKQVKSKKPNQTKQSKIKERVFIKYFCNLRGRRPVIFVPLVKNEKEPKTFRHRSDVSWNLKGSNVEVAKELDEKAWHLELHKRKINEQLNNI